MRFLNSAATALAALMIVAMAGITSAEVIARYFFDVSFEIADELGGYLLVASVFLGLGPALAGGAMLRVEMVEQRLPAAMRRGLDLLFHLGALIIAAIALYWVWLQVASSVRRETVSASWLEVPIWLPQAAMPLGLVLLILTLLAGLARLLRRGAAA